MEAFWKDVVFAVRSLRRRPVLALVVALTLGLGVGATTAVFSVVDAVLLRPLPYPAPERLAAVSIELPTLGRARAHAAGPELQALWDGARSFAAVGGLWARPGVLRGDDGPVDEIEVAWVTPGLLEALAVRPLLGRLPTHEELVAETTDVMVLSHGLWQRRYGSDPGIVGRRIDFDDERRTVIGVMPPGLRLLFNREDGVPEDVGAFLPWGGGYAEMARAFRIFTTVGRLRPDASFAQAGEELRAIGERVRGESAEYASSGFGFRVEPLEEGVVAHVRPALLLLAGVVAFVLLIACANVANLSLARALDAERELALRQALGASRWRLVRGILTESTLLGVLGAAVGLWLAARALDLLRILAPGTLPRLDEVALGGRALWAAAAAALLASLVAGAIGASRALATAGRTSLRPATRDGSVPASPLRGLLVVSQVALSLVLLVGASLLLKSFARLAAVNPGFDPRSLLTLRLSLPDVHYSYRKQGPKIADFYRRLDERIASLPGIEQVGATLNPPLSGLPLRERPYAWRAPAGEVEWGRAEARYTTVTPGWFRAAKLRLVSGRFLDARDHWDAPLSAVVDVALARRAWPGTDAIGQDLEVEVFRQGEFRRAWATVVGVVDTVHLGRLEAAGAEQIWLAHAQAPQRTMYVTVRSTLEQTALVSAVQAEVASLEKDLPVFDVRLASEHVARATSVARFASWALAAFAVLAALVATGGVYAVIAYIVSRRRHEIGVRLALGATPAAIRGLVVGQGLALIVPGLVAGLLGAAVLARFLSSLLFGVTPRDPATFLAVPALLAAVAVLACLLPARRAARLDPTEALRTE
jgi:putative ABC transport system permease protein